MCGRYTLTVSGEVLETRFDARAVAPIEPTYNAAPREPLPVIRADRPDEIAPMTWGLTPSWADDRRDLINARSETASEKRSFREAYRERPCLVLADGFYEWVEEGGAKRPYRVARRDGEPFAMAGLWEAWTPPTRQTGLDAFTDAGDAGESEPTEAFTILTTEPNEVVKPLHHRMAVVLPEDREREWLTADPDARRELLRPIADDDFHAYPVSTAVNDPSAEGPELIEEVGA
jgi:putative SOS response-associated peptidase YedK